MALAFIEEIARVGWHLTQTLVWVKNAFVPGRADYHFPGPAVPKCSMARPTELTPEFADRVAQLIRAGNFPEAAGVSGRSYYRWMARGEKAAQVAESGKRVHRSEERYRQFWQQIKRAERESEAIAVSHLTKAMPHTPTAVIAWLERRFRDRWSRTERTELTGADGGPVAVDSPAERILAEAARIRARLEDVADDRSRL